MQDSIQIMLDSITGILSLNNPTIYLFGSVVLDDFKLGWSDIDILCLTEKIIDVDQANELVTLRQSLLHKHPGNPYFRSFEGGILTWNTLLSKEKDIVVYWGTSGQRICDSYQFDPFSKMELLTQGRHLYGPDHRDRIPYPSREAIVQAIHDHYCTIRQYARETNQSLYSAGWLLDIARCLYTLKASCVIAKTEAGRWAVVNDLVPDEKVMERSIWVREHPLAAKSDEQTMQWLATLGPHIQRFADVLEEQLTKVQSPV